MPRHLVYLATLAAIVLFLTVTARCQSLPDAPSAGVSRRRVIMVTGLQLATTGLDAWRTDINRQSHGTEADPVARPFVLGGRGRLVGYFGCQVALKLLLPRLVRRMGHPRVAAAMEVYGIADSAWGAGYSWAHTTR